MKLLFVIICVLCFISCNKFLEEKPNATLVVPKTLQDLQAMMDDNVILNIKTVPSLSESYVDDWYLPDKDLENLHDYFMDMYIRNPIEYEGGYNDWSRSYQAIYYSNYVLEQIEKINRNNYEYVKWDQVKGSAHFFKAFHYLTLLAQFGHAYDKNLANNDLGIVLRQTSNYNDKSVRSSVGDCYMEIIENLTKASELLPIYSEHPMRPSKVASYALLARTFLYMGDFENTLLYSQKALMLNSNLIDYNGDSDLVPTANYSFKRFNKETLFYAELATVVYSVNSSPVDTSLIIKYSENDYRKKYFFQNKNGYVHFNGNYSGSAVPFGGLTTSELYLMSAEAKAVLGDKQGALNDLNFLLVHRYDKNSFVPIEINEIMDVVNVIREERRKELIGRNLRWIDIKRYNKLGHNIHLTRIVKGIEYVTLPNASIYALPLPKDIIEITGIPQN